MSKKEVTDRLHWALWYAMFNPFWHAINKRWIGTSGRIQFWIAARFGHELDIWDQAIGCNTCGWTEW